MAEGGSFDLSFAFVFVPASSLLKPFQTKKSFCAVPRSSLYFGRL